MPADTPTDVQAIQDRIHRQMTDRQRLDITFSLTNLVRQGIRQRIQQASPELSPDAVHRQMIRELYGVQLRD